MRRLLLLVATAWPSSVVAAPVGRGAEPHPAVCRVVVPEAGGEAFGSGTLVDARDQYGMVVTNWHVVRDHSKRPGAGKIEVVFPSGFRSDAQPLKLDETWDLAALVVWRPPTEPVDLAPHPPRPGDTLTICGYGGGDYRAQTGRCTDYYSPEVGLPQELVELSVEARQGDSGGPIFNERGELAGVLFGAGQGTTLGSFGGRVRTFLASLAPDLGSRKPTRLASSPTPGPFVTSSFPLATPSDRRSPSAAAQQQSVASAPARRPAPLKPRPASSAVDPFLAAEQRPSPVASGVPFATRASAPAATAPPVWRPSPVAPQGAATYVAAAPRYEAFRPATPASPASPSIAAAPKPDAWQPNAPAVEPASPIPGAIDWNDDGRTLLAIVGGAALVMGGLRVLGG